MPKSRLSGPLLPAKYIQEVESHDSGREFQSTIYQRDAHEARIAMRQWLKPRSPDSPVVLRDPVYGFSLEAQRTYLHLYAISGDILALSELIGMGATPDKADTHGMTPLHLAFMEMAKLKCYHNLIIESDRGAWMKPADKERAFTRLAWVARILIQQHANVKIEVFGHSLIGLASSWEDWDTVTLLLKHGATLSPSPMSCFQSPADKKRFFDLLRSVGVGHPRPPRICPCWSGKVVPDCHGRMEQPYPLAFICVCGSGKTYEQCCHSRGRFVTEQWDRKSQRILHDYDRSATMPEPYREKYRRCRARYQSMMESAEELGLEIDSTTPDVLEEQKKVAAEMLSKGLIDPAFAYAMQRANFFPNPRGRNSSRHLRKEMQADWNKLIDAYIDRGEDLRSREEIERLTKIGSGNGALFRKCEGGNCENIERSGVKFNCCSGCKFAVYCSRSCQKAAWGTHKAICSSGDQLAQPLPSQEAIRREIISKLDFGNPAAFLSLFRHVLSAEPSYFA